MQVFFFFSVRRYPKSLRLTPREAVGGDPPLAALAPELGVVLVLVLLPPAVAPLAPSVEQNMMEKCF